MKRGQIHQSGELSDDLSVNYDRCGKDIAPVDDAVADGLDVTAVGQRRGDLLRAAAAPNRRQVGGMGNFVVIIDDSQLEAARTGIDDQDPHATARLIGPNPVANLGRILPMRSGVSTMLDTEITQGLSKAGVPGSQPRDAVDHIHDEMESIEVVQHDHVKWGGSRSLFLVTPNVKIGMIGAPISKAMDQPWVAVIGEDDGLVRGEQ